MPSLFSVPTSNKIVLIPATSVESIRSNLLADFPALLQGTAGNRAPTTPPLPEGFTLDATPNLGMNQTQPAPTPAADFDLSKLPDLPDGFALDSDPSVSNPEGVPHAQHHR